MEKIYKNNLSIWFYFNILITFQLINIAKSQLINNIIKLGENNFTYSHFSFNSNGDMIIDTSTFPVNKERFFFGLNKMVNSILKTQIIQKLLIIWWK